MIMEDKSLYLLAEFDDDTERVLSDYYSILKQHGLEGKQTKNIPYHITLGSYDTSYENRLIDELETVCYNTPEIELLLSHLGIFGLDVLFAGPNINYELLSLHKSFCSDSSNDIYPWTAHATLLIDSPENILKALQVIAHEFKPVRTRITSISLYEFFPTR